MHQLDETVCQTINRLLEKASTDADPRDALASCEQALELLPPPKSQWQKAGSVYAAIGRARMRQGRFAQAADDFFDAKNCPSGMENPNLLFCLGQCLFEIGELDRARELFLRVHTLDGDPLFLENDLKYFASIRSIVSRSSDFSFPSKQKRGKF